MNKIEKLEKIQDLFQKGILNEEEFLEEKKKILNNQMEEQKLNVQYTSNIIDTKQKEKTKNIKDFIKSKKYIIILLVFILVIILGIILINNRETNHNNNVENDNKISESLNENKKIYITQDSNVSLTGKEFIGKFSDELMVETNDVVVTEVADTFVDNIKKYSIKYKVKNTKTKNYDVVFEEIYYYNQLNNNIIAKEISITSVSLFTQTLYTTYNMSINEWENMMLNGASNIFQNLNSNSDEEAIKKSTEYYEYVNRLGNNEQKDFTYNDFKYTYTLIGHDLLNVIKKSTNDSNSFTWLLLAVDENSDLEEEIKIWQNNMNTEIDTIETNFIEEIYKKYSVAEGCICSNGDEYWLLDKEGKKVYFDSVESFESAMQICGLNLLENNSDEFNNNPQNNYKDSIKTDDKYINVPNLIKMTEEEAIELVEKLEIPYEIKYSEDVSRSEGIVLDQTTHTNVITNSKGEIVVAYNTTTLKKGETLAIIVNKYKDRTINCKLHIGCLVELYKKICQDQGITAETNNYKFNIEINNEVVFNETISKNELIETIKDGLSNWENNYKEFDSIEVLDNVRRFGDCGLIQTKEIYTGYGILDCKISINGITLVSNHCDLYHDDNGITETRIDEKKAFLIYEENDENKYNITFSIYYKEHGVSG